MKTPRALFGITALVCWGCGSVNGKKLTPDSHLRMGKCQQCGAVGFVTDKANYEAKR